MSSEQGVLFENPYRKEGKGPLEFAARASINGLRKYNALDVTHSLKVEMIIQGARMVDLEFARGHASTAAGNLFSKLIDIADGLPTVQQAVTSEFDRIAAALADAE